jgi:glucose-1-phosphate thymidylyltransferase
MTGSVARAVILAAGQGTRMRLADPAAVLTVAQAAAADRGWKALMPIHGRPLLDYGLSVLADAGVGEVCIVVGPGDSPLRELYRKRATERVRLAFAVQSEPRGSGDALASAEEFAAGGDFLALNSDNLYPVSALRALLELDGPGLPVFERERLLATSNFTRERVDAFAVLDVGADGFLRAIVEKPPGVGGASGRVLLSMNLWRFSPAIFEACRRVPISTRGERELPQAAAWAIANRGERFRAVPCAEGVLDLSTRADVARVEARLQDAEPRL